MNNQTLDISPHVIRALEFDKVLGRMSRHACSAPGREAALQLLPLAHREDITSRSAVISEIRLMASQGGPLACREFQDVRGPLQALKPAGSVLEGAEVASFLPLLSMAEDISEQILGNQILGDQINADQVAGGQLPGWEQQLPGLTAMAEELTVFPDIRLCIEKSVDDTGRVFDNASRLLGELRGQVRRLEARIEKRLAELTSDPVYTPFLQDDFVTRRSGRWVVPVRMDSKGQIKGVVHDVSRSGETAFVEPVEIIGLTNELENLRAEEKAEVIRILRELSAMLREVAEPLLEDYRVCVALDMLNALGRFSDELHMSAPIITDSGLMHLVSALHPLLLYMEKEGAIERAVPLDLQLKVNERVMVITGPNAGGKTIAIKTTGLLCLMALCGMHLPAASGTTVPMFNNVLVDIGDEQSIEASLSTFSAHVSRLSAVLSGAGPLSLVLMDELGTGTEPGEGAAISCGVLNSLNSKGATVLATTHLTDIVGFVHKTEGMVNASMRFDPDTLSPLFELVPGVPGLSHAIEIASRYGMPEDVVRFARGMAGSMKVELQGLLSDLREKAFEQEKARAGFEAKSIELHSKEALLSEKLRSVAIKEKELLKGAYEEARGIVLDVKRQAHELLKTITEKKSKKALKEITSIKQGLDEKIKEFEQREPISMADLGKGDMVYVLPFSKDAEVLSVDAAKDRVKVRMGAISMEVPAIDLSPPKGGRAKPSARATGWGGVSRESDDTVSAAMSINIVGRRVGEIDSELEPFLNRASLAGLSEVMIIHGVGTGALKKAVAEFLDMHPLVSGVRPAVQEEGGAGVTVVMVR